MVRHRTAALVAVVGLVLLAGCLGALGGDDGGDVDDPVDGNETDAGGNESGTDGDGSDGASDGDDGPDGDGDGSGDGDGDGSSDGDGDGSGDGDGDGSSDGDEDGSGDGDGDGSGDGGDGDDGDGSVDPDADAEQVKTDALDAMAAVETYGVEGEIEQRISGQQTVTIAINTSAVFDREQQVLRARQVERAMGQEAESETYVVNESVYSRSPQFVQQYGGEWIVRHPEDFEGTWSAMDTMTRQREILDISEVTLDGTETVGDTEAYVLVADVPNDEYEEMALALASGGASPGGAGTDQIDVHEVGFTFWLDPGTGHPVRSEGFVNFSVTSQGQETTVEQSLDLEYVSYGEPVGIALPAAAESAIDVEEAASRLTADAAPGAPA